MIPTLFSIGSFTLHSYGVMVALAFSVAIYLARRQAIREGIQSEIFLDMSLWVIVGGILGARTLYVIVSWEQFTDHWLDVFKLWQGGLVFYGGLIGALLAVLLYCRKHKFAIWKLFDICAPYAALGHALGRIGCFLNGCCYGKVNATWGVVFPALNDSMPHLPTQLYESLADFLIFTGLVIFRKFKRFEGQLLWLYIMVYALVRFGLEFLRGDEIRGTIGISWLHTSQLIALILFVVSAGMLGILGRGATIKKNHSNRTR